MPSTGIGNDAVFTHTAPHFRPLRGTIAGPPRRLGQLRRLADGLSVPRMPENTQNLGLRERSQPIARQVR